MKTVIVILAASVASVVFAADLELSDGRTFKDYRIISQTATTVTVRHAGGAAKVNKSILPAEVLKAHPIDQRAAAAEVAANAQGKAIYEAQAQAAREQKAQAHEAFLAEVRRKRELELGREEERRAQSQAMIDAARAQRSAAKVIAKQAAVDSLPVRIKEVVEFRADEYFRTEHKAPNSSYKYRIRFNLREPKAVPGWPGRYTVAGMGYYEYYESRGSGFGAEKAYFEATVDTEGEQGVRVTSFDRRSGPPLL